MKKELFSMAGKPVLAALVLAGVMSCSKEDDGIPPSPPDPPFPPVEYKAVELKAEVIEPEATDSSVLFVSKWNDAQCVLAVSLGGGGVSVRTSVIQYNPVTELRVTQGIGSCRAVLSGRVLKGADSVVVFKSGKDLLTPNLTHREYETDSLPDVFRFDAILYGTARLDTAQEAEIEMKHITSVLDVRLVNKTGLDLKIKQVVIYPSDPDCTPFLRSLRSAILYYGKSYGDMNALIATYSKGRVAKEATFTVRHPLLLVNDSILNNKALIYSIHTDRGVYSYTKSGCTYAGGKRHIETVVMEGQ